MLSTFCGAISNLVGMPREAMGRLQAGKYAEAAAAVMGNFVVATISVAVMTSLMLLVEGNFGPSNIPTP